MTATISPVMTEQEYLQQEESATVRHEFINGKLYEMPGGMYPHEQVTGNIQFILKTQGLRANSQGLRVRLPETKDYYYPDVVVTEEKVARVAFIEKPTFISEVLSPSTRTNDLTDKFIAYRQFPTLLYYLLVEPDFCYATLFSKNEEGIWESEVYNHLSSVILLTKLSASLPLTGIYEDIEWTEGN